MHVLAETAALPEILFQANFRQTESLRVWLAAKRKFDQVRAETYLRHVPGQTHSQANAHANIAPEVIAAREELDEAHILHEFAKHEADRVANTLELVMPSRKMRVHRAAA